MKLETQTEQLISETVTVYGLSPQIGIHALAQTVNALAGQGAGNIRRRYCSDCLSGIHIQIQDSQD